MAPKYILADMSKSAWAQVDAYLFRAVGTALGLAGCVALVMNNPSGELFSNVYGIIFLIIFSVLGVYSLGSLVKDIIGNL